MGSEKKKISSSPLDEEPSAKVAEAKSKDVGSLVERK